MRFQAMCTGTGILTAAIVLNVVVGLLVVKALYDGVHDLVDVLQLRRLLSFMCSCYFRPQAPTIQGTRPVNCGVEQLAQEILGIGNRSLVRALSCLRWRCWRIHQQLGEGYRDRAQHCV